jgi:hypothetical protein
MNAASSGAFVLSESYLYTTEAIREALAHLKPGGVVCLQTGDIDFAHKPNRATRYLSTARAALTALGHDFGRHVLVSSTPEFFTMVTILLSAQPFSAEQVRRFREDAARAKPAGASSTVWHPPDGAGAPQHPVQQVIALPEAELAAWRASHPYRMSPVTDDSPFFWHFTGFWNAFFRAPDRGELIFDPEDAKGERALGVLLLVATALAAAFLLLPLAAIRETWSALPHKGGALCYFSALGLGFMFFEIPLIQKLTLFLGYPTYSLSVTLFSLLVFSGLGSLASGRWAAARGRVLPALWVGLALLTLFYQYGLGPAAAGLAAAPLPLRALCAAAFLAPLGLCLGAFLPVGLGAVAALTPQREAYVAWCWAVNGFFSVVSSVLATMLSMTFGFRGVLFLALLAYAVAVLALARIPAPRAAPAP